MSTRSEPTTYGLFFKKEEDPKRCIASVWNPVTRNNYQCTRKRGFGDGGAYCAQHDPESVARRQKKATEKWRERNRRMNQPYYDQCRMKIALQMIADGHNDPRRVAQAALEQTGMTLNLEEGT